ncbi:transporter substrate-binding domain-containing protein [Lacimicrobium alkaliphilum]|uniref:transporter substrate-binding domain-containing protein n=1 Tax=Lacimicrobium alkaliphilum TaxID=1526571 RepID=UPI001179E3C4|nr:transporter substrate-binding domain-containing protein [Lacimicrobium alkaliphilum]
MLLRLVLTLIFAASSASAAPMIWLAESSPGFEKTIKMDEQTRDLILSGLDNINFQIEPTNPKRGLNRLQHESNICVGDKIYNAERQRYSLASAIPQVVVPGLRLYLREELAVKNGLNTDKSSELSLSQLLKNLPDLQLGVMQGRSYGEILDQLLAAPALQRRIWRRSGTDMGAGLVAMLLNGRIDAIFEYPNVFKQYSQHVATESPITYLRLKETPAFISGYVLCSRSEAGKQAIDAISKSIEQLSRNREYLDIHLQWFDEDMHSELTRYYNRIYGTAFDLSQ